MSADLIFPMGKFEARIPTERRYARNHLWLQPILGKPGSFRVGFTSYSVRLLQDVYFLDWNIDPETPVRKGQQIGEIESSKALSSLYPPGPGVVGAFNAAVLADPTPINTDNYGSGWLYEFQTEEPFLEADAYVAHLAVGWEQDQRYLKGQVNRGQG